MCCCFYGLEEFELKKIGFGHALPQVVHFINLLYQLQAPKGS
jgi:hypothetical protein